MSGNLAVVYWPFQMPLHSPFRNRARYARTYYLKLLTTLAALANNKAGWIGGGSHLKVHAYHIVQRGNVSLVQTLTHVAQLQLPNRLRTVSAVPMRLEHCVQQGPYWLMDFTLIRRKGPGRASPTEPVSDFDLEDDEGFGEETAAIYAPNSGFMALQYNHYGPRQSRIQAYLHSMSLAVAGQPDHVELPDSQNGFDFNPLLKAEAVDRLDNLGIIKTISASFHVPGVLARPEARRRSLTGLLDMPIMGGAQNVQFEISAGRGKERSLHPNRVRQAVRELLAAREEINSLTVTAKENADAPSEPVDFLDARLETDVEVALVGRRYPRAQRLAALRLAFETWRDDDLLNA